MPLFVHNSLRKRPEPFSPRNPARVTFYTCGPTVYDDAHIGNFRSFLAADLLRRWVESPLCEVTLPDGSIHKGPRTVVHVMNITDVGHMTDDDNADGAGEDKMALAGRRLAEAKKAGKLPDGVDINPADPYAIAAFYANRFLDDAKRLGLKVAIEAEQDPSLMPRATATIEGMISTIQRLIDRGHAYVAGEGDARAVYFDVRSFGAYGRLSGNTLEALHAGKGGRVSEAHQSTKRHPADFLLWKADPSHIMKWDSPWGAGYPGWHIECSAMSFERLVRAEGRDEEVFPDGEALIDIHSGGEDNIFPHHECEIAQSCCAFNQDPDEGTFARLWFHPRFLLVEGEKMSKSKGNFFTARQLFERGVEPAALRLELIKTHYRSNANFTEQGLKDSARMVNRWREVARQRPGDEDSISPGSGEAIRAFTEAMNDDLNVARAIGIVNFWIGRAGDPKRGDAHVMRTFFAPVLGIDLEFPSTEETSVAVYAAGTTPNERLESLLVERRDARAAKDFKRADEIRDELSAMGYAIKDAPGGKVEVSRAP